MDVLTNLQKLPPVCAVSHPETGEPVMIKRGVMGFHEMVVAKGFSIEKFNAVNGVTPAQQSAMLMGSMFGWDTPAADADNPVNQPKEVHREPTSARPIPITSAKPQVDVKKLEDEIKRSAS